MGIEIAPHKSAHRCHPWGGVSPLLWAMVRRHYVEALQHQREGIRSISVHGSCITEACGGGLSPQEKIHNHESNTDWHHK